MFDYSTFENCNKNGVMVKLAITQPLQGCIPESYSGDSTVWQHGKTWIMYFVTLSVNKVRLFSCILKKKRFECCLAVINNICCLWQKLIHRQSQISLWFKWRLKVNQPLFTFIVVKVWPIRWQLVGFLNRWVV